MTCYPLAQAAVYHCYRSDDEVVAKIGRYGYGYTLNIAIVQDVFTYGSRNVTMLKRLKRWMLLLVIAIFAPCLCCYLPAKGIYRCFGPRGGRHTPSRQYS
ncbi:unnamed protein product [Enterobius vermicularis]|uniref:G_PROTEIN_RECEP_F1_2 domain-containing protein n=1 Tax=Enterobius vermicularis TaxID=51028 RepID=A0A0N4VJT0_ENTVE|nr:unnamed protein product [Enterobius vermicularis]